MALLGALNYLGDIFAFYAVSMELVYNGNEEYIVSVDRGANRSIL